MRVFIFAVALLCIAEAKPNINWEYLAPRASFGRTPYIIGGSSIDISDHPHQISLQFSSGNHICGGSVIASNKIACAAHCTQNSASNYRIRAGSSDRRSGGQTRTVAVVTNHPQYCSSCGGFPNDISTLTLSSGLEYNSNVQAISLATADFTGQTCTITGWGRTSSSNSLPVTLQGANIGVISNSQCRGLMSSVIGASINLGHICLYDSANRIGSCNGDSGGPLKCGNDLAGLTSWGISSAGSCRQDFPSVYTRISYYRNWLQTN